MKRLALLAVATAAFAAGSAAPAAAVITCDNVPALVNCYHWGPNGVEHCAVWVAPRCINDAGDLLGPIG